MQKGTVKYDAAQGRDAFAAIAAMDNATSRTLRWRKDWALARAFTGTLADGARCLHHYECAVPTSRCVPESNPEPCYATCTPHPSGCTETGECPDGLMCDRSGEETSCVPAASPGADRAPCAHGGACQPGLVCDQDGAQCGVPGSEGPVNCGGSPGCLFDNCGAGMPCSDGLMCMVDDERHATQCAVPKKKGDACTIQMECGGELGPLVCDETSHTCVTRPATGPCINEGFGEITLACDGASAFCDRGETPVCVPYMREGEACYHYLYSIPCAPGLWCQPYDSDPGTCVSPRCAP